VIEAGIEFFTQAAVVCFLMSEGLGAKPDQLGDPNERL
jgi:hypothetical protein